MGELNISVNNIKIGNKISRDVIDKNNKVIIKKDTVIDNEIRDILILNSVNEVWIYEESNSKKNEVKDKVDRIFSRVCNDEFIQKIYKIVLEFRIKNNL